jgi:hypothetical protein
MLSETGDSCEVFAGLAVPLPSVSGLGSRVRGTTRQVNVASQASLPST